MMNWIIPIYKIGFICTLLYFGYLIIENIFYNNGNYVFSWFKKSTILLDIFILVIISIFWFVFFTGFFLFKFYHKRNIIGLIIVSFSISFLFMPEYSFFSKKDIIEFNNLKNEYSWLTIQYYETLKRETKLNNIPIALSCSLIQSESNGKNVVSGENSNGTRDYGLCQVNSVHCPNNPEKLLHYMYNIKLSCKYLGSAFKKAKKYYKKDKWYYESIRMYNQGLYGKRYAYNGWNYVNKTVNRYLAYTNKVNEV